MSRGLPRRARRRRGWHAAGLALTLTALTTGCSTYERRSQSMYSAFAAGRFAQAASTATTMEAAKETAKDYLVWRLEEGAAQRAAGDLKASVAAFTRAEDAFNRYAEEAKIKVGSETGALLTNQANLPYRGQAYDAIMLSTYQALNCLALGDLPAARVHLVRAYERQKDAVFENQKRIEKMQEDLNKQKDSKAIVASRDNPALQQALAGQYAETAGLQAYADYVNPFTVWLDAVLFLTQATDASDFDHARKSFERLAAFVPANEYVRSDRDRVEAVAKGDPLEPSVYVVFETGLGPSRQQIRIDVPIIISNVSYVGAAFPKLVLSSGHAPALDVEAGGRTWQTQGVASMDSVVAREFHNDLPVIITKTVASTVVKAVAAYAINDAAARQGEAAKWVARLTTAALQAAVNVADLRTWRTLPKEFQVARLPMPGDRRLRLRAANAGPGAEVVLGDGRVVLVHVKSVNASAPLVVSQAKLLN